MGESRNGRVVRDTSPLFLAGAIVALGALLQFTNGSVPPGLMGRAMASLTLVALLAAVGTFAWPRFFGHFSEKDIARWIFFMVPLQLVIFALRRPALSLAPDDGAWILPLAIGLTLVAGLAIVAIRGWTRSGAWIVPALILIFIGLAALIVAHTPNPGIDVIVFQREGIAALARGESPYGITMPQVYGGSTYYGPGLVQDGRLLIGVPYPPLSLLLQFPFERLMGDFRYAAVAALAVAAWLLARMRGNLIGTFAALLLLFTPRSLFVIEQGWTEPFVALALACVVFAAVRKPGWLPLALGSLFAMKQYTIFLAPIVFLLVPAWTTGRVIRLIAMAFAIAAAITLPFALWNWSGFYRSVIEFQFLQPFRSDSLSYLAWYARVTGSQLPSWVGFVTMAIAMVVVAWKAPRTPAGFAAGGAVILFALFAFSKQAFCNYYFLVLSALAASLAANDGAHQVSAAIKHLDVVTNRDRFV